MPSPPSDSPTTPQPAPDALGPAPRPLPPPRASGQCCPLPQRGCEPRARSPSTPTPLWGLGEVDKGLKSGKRRRGPRTAGPAAAPVGKSRQLTSRVAAARSLCPPRVSVGGRSAPPRSSRVTARRRAAAPASPTSPPRAWGQLALLPSCPRLTAGAPSPRPAPARAATPPHPRRVPTLAKTPSPALRPSQQRPRATCSAVTAEIKRQPPSVLAGR